MFKSLLIKAYELLDKTVFSVSILWMNLKQQIALINISLDVAIDLKLLYPENALENKITNY